MNDYLSPNSGSSGQAFKLPLSLEDWKSASPRALLLLCTKGYLGGVSWHQPLLERRQDGTRTQESSFYVLNKLTCATGMQ